MLVLLGFDGDTPTITDGEGEGLAALFARLLPLEDVQVMAVLSFVMAEILWTRS